MFSSLPPLLGFCIFLERSLNLFTAHNDFISGSSAGRGTRASGWFADYILEKEGGGAGGMQSLVLEGGIKGWVGAGKEYVEQVVGYEAAAWKSTECA